MAHDTTFAVISNRMHKARASGDQEIIRKAQGSWDDMMALKVRAQAAYDAVIAEGIKQLRADHIGKKGMNRPYTEAEKIKISKSVSAYWDRHPELKARQAVIARDRFRKS